MSDIQRAFDVRQSIIEKKHIIAEGFLDLGELFNEVIEKSLWKLSGADSLASFCADPEIGFSEKTAYQYAGLYKRWLLEWGVDKDQLIRIGPAKLEIIKKKYAEADEDGREELIGIAEHNSVSALLEEMGKPRKAGPRKVSQAEADYKAGETFDDYDKWKMAQGCCTCGEPATEKSHFPKTRGAGCREDEWFPMCADCHRMFHQVGVDTFISKYKYPLFSWIHGRLSDAWDRVKP